MIFEPHPERWMRNVYAAMAAPFDKLKDNAVTFLTFNYDRSLEHCLFELINHGYGLPPDDEIQTIMKSFNIIHLHGNLGDLPWQQTDAVRPYTNEITKGAIDICIQKIKIVHEPIVDERDKEFFRARVLLRNAQRVYCLGFGYGAQNMRNLDFISLPNGAIRGSGVGLTSHECNLIKASVEGRVSVYGSMSCATLLRNVAMLS